MTNDHNPLPRGIRINNPGNLRSAVGPYLRTQIVDGFASFATMEQGATSLFYLIDQYYRHLLLTSLPQFVSRYAPASENDVQAYVLAVARRIGVNPLKLATTQLELNVPWKALDFARAIIHVEQGAVTDPQNLSGEWVGIETMAKAMRITQKWVTN